MDIRVLSLDFDVQGGIAYPRDKHLLKLVTEFASQELSSPYNPTNYLKVLAVCECDEQGTPQKVIGLASGGWVFDWSQVRFTSPEAGKSLIERMRHYMDDLGARGRNVFVFIANHEAKESRCPRWRSLLKTVGAVKASRWNVTA